MAAKAPTKLRPTGVKTWTLPGLDEPLKQDPLSFFEKNEFFGLISDSLDAGLRRGLDLRTLVEMIGLDQSEILDDKGQVDLSKLPPLDSMASVLLRLLSMTPEIMEEAYLIVLSVEAENRLEVRRALRRIDDDTGFGILETFFDQNSSAIAAFLPRWKAQLTKAMDLVKPMMNSGDASPPSTS